MLRTNTGALAVSLIAFSACDGTATSEDTMAASSETPAGTATASAEEDGSGGTGGGSVTATSTMNSGGAPGMPGTPSSGGSSGSPMDGSNRAGAPSGGGPGDGATVAPDAGSAVEPEPPSAGGSAAMSTQDAGESPDDPMPRLPSVLVFSKTTEFRHDSIEVGVEAMRGLASDGGWNFTSTEDASTFTTDGLVGYNVVVFLNTTGDVLDEAQQTAMETFIRADNGFVGVHSASDTEYDWPWYGELVGAYFQAHPAIQPAVLSVEDATHPVTLHLSESWSRTDEWYGFRTNPRPNVDVLLTLDESSYDPGDGAMGEDHPITWSHDFDGGRSFYTALGHTQESYAESDFLRLLDAAVRWAAGTDAAR